jgi:hypothetical protein
MAQADQQLQNESLKVNNVHFRWMGSNAPIASLKANDPHFELAAEMAGAKTRSIKYTHLGWLQRWLAPKLGLRPFNWFQVTLYSGKQRLTHDVLLGAHLLYGVSYDYRCSLMPHIGQACRSFITQVTKATTTDIVVHVTRCPDADCEAALKLSCWHTDAKMWDKYCNNVVYMINAATRFDYAFCSASLKMRQNELVAIAALNANKGNAQFVSPALWNKPSFVLKAAALGLDFSTYLDQHQR